MQSKMNVFSKIYSDIKLKRIKTLVNAADIPCRRHLNQNLSRRVKWNIKDFYCVFVRK